MGLRKCWRACTMPGRALPGEQTPARSWWDIRLWAIYPMCLLSFLLWFHPAEQNGMLSGLCALLALFRLPGCLSFHPWTCPFSSRSAVPSPQTCQGPLGRAGDASLCGSSVLSGGLMGKLGWPNCYRGGTACLAGVPLVCTRGQDPPSASTPSSQPSAHAWNSGKAY